MRLCSRYATKDGYCTQHHPDFLAERQAIRDEKWEEKKRNSPEARLKRVVQENDKLKRENAALKLQLKNLQKKLLRNREELRT
jgi:ubiquinone biosynthesis protein UbiJ